MAHKKGHKGRSSRKSRGVNKSTLRALKKSVNRTNSLLKKVSRQSRKSRH